MITHTSILLVHTNMHRISKYSDLIAKQYSGDLSHPCANIPCCAILQFIWILRIAEKEDFPGKSMKRMVDGCKTGCCSIKVHLAIYRTELFAVTERFSFFFVACVGVQCEHPA